MKKIAYIELDTHAELASQFYELVKGSQQFDVDYYFSERVYRQLGIHASNVALCDAGFILDGLKGKDYDLIIIGTVHRYFNIFNQICRNNNVAVIIHNRNFLNVSKMHLLKSIFLKDSTYRLKLLLKEDLLAATKISENAKHLLVLDEAFISKSNNEITFLPLFFNQSNGNGRRNLFRIVIPGAVSQQRRDYGHVFQKMATWNSEVFTKPVEIVFLGKATGHELKQLQKLEKKLPENLRVQYFAEKVPQKIFDRYMETADVLWCPVQKQTEFFSQPETYGETKLTGNIGDAIRYGKFAIFPKWFPGTHPFVVKEEKSLETQFVETANRTYDFRKNFSKEKVRQKLDECLSAMISD